MTQTTEQPPTGSGSDTKPPTGAPHEPSGPAQPAEASSGPAYQQLLDALDELIRVTGGDHGVLHRPPLPPPPDDASAAGVGLASSPALPPKTLKTEPVSGQAVPPSDAEKKPDDLAAAPKKKPRKKANKTKRRLVLLALVLFSTSILSPLVSHLSPTQAFVVASGSMEPQIPKGALVVAHPQEPQVGDVVAYWSPIASYQIHRVVEIQTAADGARTYRTKGDANDAVDSFLVPERDVVGVITFSLDYAGYVWLMPVVWQVGIFFALLASYFGLTVWDARKAPRPGRPATNAVAVAMILLVLLPGAYAAADGLHLKFESSALPQYEIADSPLPMAAGTEGPGATVANRNATANVTTPDSELWKEILMCGGCSETIDVTTYNATNPGVQILVNTSKYDPAPTFYLEAVMRASAGQSISVILRNATDGATVSGTEITTSSTANDTVLSSGFTLTGNKTYEFLSKVSGGSGEVHQVKLLVRQIYPVDTETQITLADEDTSTSAVMQDHDGTAFFVWDGSKFDGATTLYLEAVGFETDDGADTDDGRLQLYDNTALGAVTESLVNLPESMGLVRGNSFSLTDGHEYRIQIRAPSGLTPAADVTIVRLIVEQQDMTRTANYIQLGLRKSTTSAAFLAVGWEAGRHNATLWDDHVTYFEGTLRHAFVGSTTRVQLTDATAAEDEVIISSSGTIYARIRSAALTLNNLNASYTIAMDTETIGLSEMRNAWIIEFVNVTGNRTDDYVVKTTNDQGTCTWNFVLDHVSSSGLARIVWASVSLRGSAEGVLREQIRIENGVLTQAVGSSVSVAPNEFVQHVVTFDPSADGSSSIAGDLEGDCASSGAHVRQRVNYNLD